MTKFGIFRYLVVTLLILSGCNNGNRKGTESSGGGGGTLSSKAATVKSTIEKHFEFLKSGDRKLVARYFELGYMQVLESKFAGDEGTGTSDLLTESHLSPKSLALYKYFKTGFGINANENSRADSLKRFQLVFDNSKLLKILNTSEVIFSKCSTENNFDKHKTAYFIQDGTTGKRRFCFDAEALTVLDETNIEFQIVSLIHHELAHAFGFDEADALAIQESYFAMLTEYSRETVPAEKVFASMWTASASDVGQICTNDSAQAAETFYQSYRAILFLIADRGFLPSALVNGDPSEAIIQKFISDQESLGLSVTFNSPKEGDSAPDQIRTRLCAKPFSGGEGKMVVERAYSAVTEAIQEYDKLEVPNLLDSK